MQFFVMTGLKRGESKAVRMCVGVRMLQRMVQLRSRRWTDGWRQMSVLSIVFEQRCFVTTGAKRDGLRNELRALLR